MMCRFAAGLLAGTIAFVAPAPAMEPGALDAMIARHAATHNLPADLVRRVIMRESRGNAGAVHAGNYGIMQIRHGTARAMGYSGEAAGLLDPEVNMTYAVKYLAGAYRAAGGDSERAISNYQRGYYHAAKRQGFSPYASSASLQPGSSFSLVREPRRPRISRRAIRQQARAARFGDGTLNRLSERVPQ
jgi:soluble lytic murein transglycosylase-like protein